MEHNRYGAIAVGERRVSGGKRDRVLFCLEKILRYDLLYLFRTNGCFAGFISGDQLHGGKDSVITVGFEFVAGSITVCTLVHHAEVLPVEELLCGRMQNREIRIDG